MHAIIELNLPFVWRRMSAIYRTTICGTLKDGSGSNDFLRVNRLRHSVSRCPVVNLLFFPMNLHQAYVSTNGSLVIYIECAYIYSGMCWNVLSVDLAVSTWHYEY